MRNAAAYLDKDNDKRRRQVALEEAITTIKSTYVPKSAAELKRAEELELSRQRNAYRQRKRELLARFASQGHEAPSGSVPPESDGTG